MKKFGKKETLELAAAPNDVYNEVRVKAIVAGDSAEPGSVFGFESLMEDRSVFTQFEFQFQGSLPVVTSRFMLSLPAGWRAEGITYNYSPVQPDLSGSTYTWQLQNLGFIEPEEDGPNLSSLAPRLAVSFFPPEGTSAGLGKVFRNWAEVSSWLTELNDPQAQPTELLAAKARSLAADASAELESVRAIGKFVQGVNYVSIQTGLGRGGGYRPHAAGDVFLKSYGDCKDKANLMRTMLKVAGIESFPVAIFSGDRLYVRPEWTSPQQFNHAILAVKVSQPTGTPAETEHPELGRLLLFDPTDTDTPVGYLPDHEQDSQALVVAGNRGSLLRMPVAPPSANRLERRTEVTLAADGSVAVRVRERRAGQASIDLRSLYRRQVRSDFVKSIESWIAGRAGGTMVSKVEVKDEPEELTLELEFSVQRYGQLMQDRLLVFRPAVVSNPDAPRLTKAKRTHLVLLDSQSFREAVRVQLPAGFRIDEMPGAAGNETTFGKHSALWEARGNELLFTRSLEVRLASVPVEDYAAARKFFAQVHGAEDASVVLARE